MLPVVSSSSAPAPLAGGAWPAAASWAGRQKFLTSLDACSPAWVAWVRGRLAAWAALGHHGRARPLCGGRVVLVRFSS